MRALYDQLSQEGEAGILRLIDERMQEGVQLDFKQKGDPRKGAFDANDKKILAKAVSGFANSAGGLLIWGVNAEKGPDGVDCAQAPAAPIAQIELFLSEATTLVGQLIQPRHDGILLHAVPSTTTPGAGYLLMHIERSNRRPHRSEASGQKQYFKRAGDSFFEMEHYDIEDAFSRVGVPELELRLSKNGHMQAGPEFTHYILASLFNISGTLARYPFLKVSGMLGFSRSGRSAEPIKMPAKQGPGYTAVFAGSDYVIHPDQEFEIINLELVADNIGGNWLIAGIPAIFVEISFDFTFGCEGARPKTGRLVMNAGDLLLPR